MTPHISVTNDTDGIKLTLRREWLVLPPDMAVELANLLMTAVLQHDPARVAALPVVTPRGDPIA